MNIESNCIFIAICFYIDCKKDDNAWGLIWRVKVNCRFDLAFVCSLMWRSFDKFWNLNFWWDFWNKWNQMGSRFEMNYVSLMHFDRYILGISLFNSFHREWMCFWWKLDSDWGWGRKFNMLLNICIAKRLMIMKYFLTCWHSIMLKLDW